MSVVLRSARQSDALAIQALISANLEAGHLLPRSLDDVRAHVPRFVVAELDGEIVGCAELARLSATVAEVRSLVVSEALRGQRIGTRIVEQLASKAAVAGYGTLCAFTHNAAHFVRLGFTIVPHIWMPEKIAHDCTGCALFRRCGQYAVRLQLQRGAPALDGASSMVHGRGIAPRRRNIERLQLTPVATVAPDRDEEAVPA
jgi:amino-acid N-acetyltransferase